MVGSNGNVVLWWYFYKLTIMRAMTGGAYRRRFDSQTPLLGTKNTNLLIQFNKLHAINSDLLLVIH